MDTSTYVHIYIYNQEPTYAVLYLNVEVIGWLIKHKNIRLAQRQLGKYHACLLAAGEIPHGNGVGMAGKSVTTKDLSRL